MASSSNNKNTDRDESVQWIENGISNRYINCHEYNEFQITQSIGFGAFSDVYRANWESSKVNIR